LAIDFEETPLMNSGKVWREKKLGLQGKIYRAKTLIGAWKVGKYH